MSLDKYLEKVAQALYVGRDERERIERSVVTIQQKVRQHFGDDVCDQRFFGSHQRETMLPHYIDDFSDVDLMIVFKDDGSKPQTYINRLRGFSERYYPRSAIGQSSPTFVLELQHMRFELVPALVYDGWVDTTVSIPARRDVADDWIETDPDSLHELLIKKDAKCRKKIRPLIRIMKYWNIRWGRPFQSYQLEQLVIEHSYQSMWSWLCGEKLSLYDRFVSFAGSFSNKENYVLNERETAAVDELLTGLNTIRRHLERDDRLNAGNALRRMLPMPDPKSVSVL